MSAIRELYRVLATFRSDLEIRRMDGDGLGLDGASTEELLAVAITLNGIASDPDSGLIGELRDVADELKAEIARGMHARKETVGPFDLERTSGITRKKWNHGAVYDAIATRLTTTADPETGEIMAEPDERYAEGIVEGISAVRTASPSPSWTYGGLAALNISPGLYCEEDRGRPGLIIRRALGEQIEGTE